MIANGWSPKPSLKDTSNQEGLVTLVPFHLYQHCSIFIIKTRLHDQQTSQQLLNDGRCPDLALSHYLRSEVGCHSEGEIEAGRQWELWVAPSSVTFASHQIMQIWKWSKVQHRLPHLVSSMYERLGGSRHPYHGWWSLQGTQRPYEDQLANLQRWGHQGCQYMCQSWHWDLTVYHHTGCQDHTLLPTSSILYKVIWGSWWGVWGQTSPWMMSLPC